MASTSSGPCRNAGWDVRRSFSSSSGGTTSTVTVRRSAATSVPAGVGCPT